VVLAAALWLSLFLRRGAALARSVRLGVLAFTLSLAVLLVSVAWSSVGSRYDRSALAHVIPGGSSLSGALHRLWHPPPLNPAAPKGEQLLATYMPGQQRVVMVVKPDLATEILVRSGRSNELPFSNPLEDSFVGSRELPALQQAVDDLQPGERMLTQRGALKVLAALRAQPSRDVLTDPIHVAEGFTPQQEWVLQRMAERFRLRVIAHDPQGFLVVSFSPRASRG
jgi:hypothetical protein